MAPPLVYDGLRLFLAQLTHTPRGIDRIDLSYARYLLEHWPGDCYGLLPMVWGTRLYNRDQALRLLESVQDLWRENQTDDADPAFSQLQGWLTGGNVTEKPKLNSTPRRRGRVALGLRSLHYNGLKLGRAAVREAPRNAIYLNISQLGWAAPVTTYWLRRRPDMRAVFMLHDVIPLQHPGMVSAGGRLSHSWMINTVIRKAAGLITTTQAASEMVMATLARQGLRPMPLCTQHLPVDDLFLQPEPLDEKLRQHSYFVICGAIEPRKNHLLLLDVWQRLLQRLGAGAPRLVIVGSPAHNGDRILRQFQQDPTIQDHVIALSGIASPNLRRLMANATAVLMPSLAEGFGLPVIEALTVGTPVLASDLPAHREVGAEHVIYLDPADPVAWFEAITNLVESSAGTDALRRRVATYRPVTRADYFAEVGAFLAEFG